MKKVTVIGKLHQAGLDTSETEPPHPDDPLLSLPNPGRSPHSAAMTEDGARKMGEVSARRVVAGLKSRLDPALIFNRRALQSAGVS